MRDRLWKHLSVGLAAIALLGAACGGANTTSTPPASPPSTPTVTSSPSPSPLVAPASCPAVGSALQISAVDNTWARPDGSAITLGKPCLTAPSAPFTVTLHNDVHHKGFAQPTHNFSIYSDSSATRSLFHGSDVGYGTSTTYDVAALSAGVYLFRCDVHPETMLGILVVT